MTEIKAMTKRPTIIGQGSKGSRKIDRVIAPDVPKERERGPDPTYNFPLKRA